MGLVIVICWLTFSLFFAAMQVWEKIIEKMNRFTDLQQLCLAFPQLEPSVKQAKKTIFMFENVCYPDSLFNIYKILV